MQKNSDIFKKFTENAHYEKTILGLQKCLHLNKQLSIPIFMNFLGSTLVCIFPQYIIGAIGQTINELCSCKFMMKETGV